MSKINKYANLYDKDGNLIRHIDEKTGKLEDYTMEELEELLDKLANDKDENGKVRNPTALNNVNWMLMQYYQKYGNPHLKEWIEKANLNKNNNEQIEEKLREVAMEVDSAEEDNRQGEQPDDSGSPDEVVSKVESNWDPEYVDFEEVTE